MHEKETRSGQFLIADNLLSISRLAFYIYII